MNSLEIISNVNLPSVCEDNWFEGVEFLCNFIADWTAVKAKIQVRAAVGQTVAKEFKTDDGSLIADPENKKFVIVPCNPKIPKGEYGWDLKIWQGGDDTGKTFVGGKWIIAGTYTL